MTKMPKYARFGLMILVSTIVMFGLMYLNVERATDMHFSETRTFMALIMGAAMAVVMLGFMLHMFDNRRANVLLLVASAAVFAVALWLVRSQVTVGDVAYMKAMIPHHSIAVLTSERARITDPRVRELADGIIESQRREIAEMEALIRDIEQKGSRGQAVLSPQQPGQQASRSAQGSR
jgi:uncharacterized protein (DUF305 family)